MGSTGCEVALDPLTLLAGVVAAGLSVYLTVALLKPEAFE